MSSIIRYIVYYDYVLDCQCMQSGAENLMIKFDLPHMMVCARTIQTILKGMDVASFSGHLPPPTWPGNKAI